MTALEVIVAAFQELGILVSGGTLNANDEVWGLGKLNRMLKTWSTDGVNLNHQVEESFDLVSGTPSYTIGPGGNFDTVRPNVIDQAFIRVDNHDYSVWPRPISEYWDLSEKTAKDRPIRLYYDLTYPLGVIYFYYVPNSSYPIHLISSKPLITYLSSATEIALPGEYEDAIVLNLALRLTSRYGQTASRELQLDAQSALSGLRALNLSNQLEGVSLGLPGQRKGTYNVDSDY